MASTRKKVNANGTVVWQAIWREGPHGGTRKQRTHNFERHADARAFSRRMEREVETRGVGDTKRMTAIGYLREWHAGLDRDDYSPATLDGYRRCIDIAERELGGVELSRLTARNLSRAYTALRERGGRRNGVAIPLAKQTVLHVHRCLHSAFEVARRQKLIPENPARDATTPKPGQSQVVAFTPDEVQRLLANAAGSGDSELQVIVSVLLACGLRRSELLGLTFDTLHLEGAQPTLTVARVVLQVGNQAVVKERPKTKASRRTLSLPPIVADLLRQQRARVQADVLAWGRGYSRDPLYVFPRPGGGPRMPESVTQKLWYLLRRVGIAKASPTHAWRHTAGTSLWNATKDVKAVQNRLGHSSPAITMTLYVHSTEDADRNAADHFESVLKRS